MTDTQCLRLHAFLKACSGLYASPATRGRLGREARCGMAQSGAAWRRRPAAYGQGNSIYRRWARGAIRASGRAGAVRGVAGQHGRARPRQKRRIRPSAATGAASAPRIHILADQRGPPPPGADAPIPPSPTTRNGTRRATPGNGAAVDSSTGDAWPPATTHTPIVAWVFWSWQGPGSG